MNVCEAIIKSLELIGVDTVFVGSGSGDADTMFALKNSNKIKTIVPRHEQAGSFMACGYAMFSDKLGVCFASQGPGAVNLVSGLAVALSDSLPILAITGYSPARTMGKGDLGESSGLNRTPDSYKLFSSITKKTFIIDNPEHTCEILEEAVNLAFKGRPGPVHINLPLDITGKEVSNYRDIKLDIKPVLPSNKKIVQFANAIEHAINKKKKITAILGYGCIRSHAEPEILKFIEKFQIPFMTTMDAKGVLPEDHPLSVGMIGGSGDPGAKESFKESDVVLAIGNSFSKWQIWNFAEGIFNNKILMQINIDKKSVNRVYKADYFMVSDIKPAITKIMLELEHKVKDLPEIKPVIKKYYNQKIRHSGNKIHPGELCREISKLLPEKSIILGDAGSHMLWLAQYLQLNKGQNYQNPGIFGPMASHVNASIGIQCANPGRRVIVGCGDGAYQLAGFELMTAVQNKIPVIWIIFNNGEYNIIKMLQKKLYGKEALNHFLNPDFVGYASSCGARGYRVNDLADFESIFKQALESNEPALIDVIIDPEVYPILENF
jgi:acetolactate synthase I/II/III large subunit